MNGGDYHLVLFVCQRCDELKERERGATVQTRCRLLRMGKGESVRRGVCEEGSVWRGVCGGKGVEGESVEGESVKGEIGRG